MINRIVLQGRITRDPELQNANMESQFIRFSIACDRGTKDQNGERQTDFINCVAFRNRAEFISKYIRKGNMIIVDGRLQSRNYVHQDGTNRTVYEVIVDNVQNVEPKAEQAAETYTAAPKKTNKTPQEFLEDDYLPESQTFIVSDDDLPF